MMQNAPSLKWVTPSPLNILTIYVLILLRATQLTGFGQPTTTDSATWVMPFEMIFSFVLNQKWISAALSTQFMSNCHAHHNKV